MLGMKPEIIPYQPEVDLVLDDSVGERRPHLPVYQETHEVNGVQFWKTEDIPLSRRNFIYRPCLPNPLFTELGYCTTEYPFDTSGVNIQDRSYGMSVLRGENSVVSVRAKDGWRTARSDVCIKEGDVYWEVEVLNVGNGSGSSSGSGTGSGSSSNVDVDVDVDKGSVQQRRQFLNSSAHVRVGISRREASLEGPVGFDSYGYGLRDFSLESIHDGQLEQVLARAPLKNGDRLGFLVSLPSVERQVAQAREYTARRIEALASHGQELGAQEEWESHGRKRQKRAGVTNMDFQRALLEDIDHANVVRDHIPIRYKNQLFYEATDYVKTTKPEYYSSDKREREEYYHLEGSYVAVFLNGEYLGKAFEEVKPFLPPFSELQYNEKFYYGYWKHGRAEGEDREEARIGGKHRKGLILRNKYVNNSKLGYYPTISCFKGGAARLVTTRSELRHLRAATDVADQPVAVLDDLYRRQIADEVVWDIVDEIEEEAK